MAAYDIEIPKDDRQRSTRVRLRDPEYHDRDGFLHVDPETLRWHDVEFGPVEGCGHIETMCRECVDRWSIDYEVHFLPEAAS